VRIFLSTIGTWSPAPAGFIPYSEYNPINKLHIVSFNVLKYGALLRIRMETPKLKISFITVIKNRTNVTIKHNNSDITLKLFENNIRSLINLIQPSDEWEYIIVDFESTDVNMTEFVETLPKKDNLKFRIITLKEHFDKGYGLNIGIQYASHDIVFFSDADMMIKSRELFDDIENFVVKQDKVLFPICWSYSNPQHTSGWKRDSGKGNVVQQKHTVVPYTRNKTWGGEDDINYYHYSENKQAYRTFYGENYVHQWHPDGEFKIMYYKD
jgi:glycosyltransferase involved in cell wall biosynthesis